VEQNINPTGRALVTGAGTRLGRAMALCLARRGHAIAVHYNTSRQAAETVVDEITALGRPAVALPADLQNDTATASLIGRAAGALGGPLDVLVNNAAVFENDTIETTTRDSWDRHMETNLRAPFVLTQAFARQAPSARPDAQGEPLARALVINMLDQRVNKLTPAFMSYTLSKMALWALTRTAAQALAPDIRVNAISPGSTLRGARQSQHHFDAQRAATILGRGANQNDVTAALEYLLGAASVTGQMICVDGGQHLGWETPDIIGNGA